MATKWEASLDPQERKLYDADWTGKIGTETITSSVWTKISGADTLVIEDEAFSNQKVQLVFSGGAVGTAVLLNHITTNAGMEYEETFKLTIAQH